MATESQTRPLTLVTLLTRWVIPLFLVATTVWFGRAVGTALYYNYFYLPGDATVPSVVGRDVKAAQRVLQAVGLDLQIDETRYQDKVPANRVMDQDPVAGRSVRVGREAGVVVSLGPELVPVPRVLGMPLRDAQMALQNAHLIAGEVTHTPRRKGDAEQIVEQNPGAGRLVKKGLKVNLVVNAGDVGRVKVPRFEGQQIGQVRDALGAANLHLGAIEWVLHEQYEAGTVIRQDPVPERRVAAGTPIDLKVSAGNDYRQHRIRQRTVSLRAPDAEGPQEFRVNVSDPTGSYPVYQATHYRGDQFVVQVTGVNGGEYEVWVNDRLVGRKRI